MSLLVSFEGRLKPYSPKEPSHHFSVQRSQRTRPVVEDVFSELVNDQNHQESKSDWHPNGANSKVKSYQKSAENLHRQYYAKDIMQEHVISLTPHQDIAKALQILSEKSFRHLPVIENGRLVGIVSDRLIFQNLASKASQNTLIEKIMVKNLITALPKTNIVEIVRAMLAEKISCLPVTDEELHLKGIITTSDLLKVILTKLPFSSRA